MLAGHYDLRVPPPSFHVDFAFWQVPLVDIPYAVPLIYQLDSSLAPIQTPWAERPLKAGWYLGDPAKVRAVQAEIKADLPDAGDEDACFMTFDGDSSETQWKC